MLRFACAHIFPAGQPDRKLRCSLRAATARRTVDFSISLDRRRETFRSALFSPFSLRLHEIALILASKKALAYCRVNFVERDNVNKEQRGTMSTTICLWIGFDTAEMGLGKVGGRGQKEKQLLCRTPQTPRRVRRPRCWRSSARPAPRRRCRRRRRWRG